MKLKMIALSIALMTSATAGDIPQSQWKINMQQTMFNLVQTGYKIVSVVKDQSDSLDVYYLQNDKSVWMCQEHHSTYKEKHSALFWCFELVQPFAVPELK
jgi:hypothetical protein